MTEPTKGIIHAANCASSPECDDAAGKIITRPCDCGAEPTKEPRVTREWLEDCIDEMIQYHEDCQPTEDIRDAEHAKEVAVYRLALRALDAEQGLDELAERRQHDAIILETLHMDPDTCTWKDVQAVIAMSEKRWRDRAKRLADAERQTCDSCKHWGTSTSQLGTTLPHCYELAIYAAKDFSCRAYQPKEPTR